MESDIATTQVRMNRYDAHVNTQEETHEIHCPDLELELLG